MGQNRMRNLPDMIPLRLSSLCAGLAIAAGFALAAPSPALAQDNACYGIATTDNAQGFVLAEVKAGPRRLYFRDSPEGASTQSQAFLVPGDRAVLSRSNGAYGCVTFLNPRGQSTSGWLPMAALDLLAAPPTPPREAWIGRWQGARILDQAIEIAPRKGPRLHVTGSATWGRADPERVARGGINSGSVLADAVPEGALLQFAESDNEGETVPYEAGDPLNCRMRVVLLGAYLAVQDNLRCGGMNVSFSGVYQRAR